MMINMLKEKNVNLSMIILTFFLFIFPITMNAASASTGFRGNSTVYVGDNVEVILYVSSVSDTTNNEGLAGFGGSLTYSTDKLELVSQSSLAPFTVEYNSGSGMIGGVGSSYINGRRDIIKLIFRAKALGSASIRYSGGNQPDSMANPVSIGGSSFSISIVNPPSSNNNLSSLSVSGASISFNKNTTSYSVKVKNDVTSITISASAEDSGAKVSGAGTKNLNYGNNSFSITVTAPSGATKTYTVNVNREDIRSTNNNLSSLKVDGDLSPSFNKNKTSYELHVPYSVENLNIKATAEDSKARVSIANQNGLVSEETREVTITVTAENGSKKVYTIMVTRGKDPNKKLDTNNNLSSLTVSEGMLSPAFDKDKTKYIVYLPYEVDSIVIEGTVEDTKYGSLEVNGPEKLSVGNNKYELIVKAEDGSTKIYTVTVFRGSSLDSEESTGSIYLKDIKVTKGSLDKKFNKKINVYKYSKRKGFKLTPILEDENSKLTINESEGVYTVIVEDGIGGLNVYSFIPKESNILIICCLVAGSVLVGGGVTFVCYKYDLGKVGKRFKKTKSDNSLNIDTIKEKKEVKKVKKSKKDKVSQGK